LVVGDPHPNEAAGVVVGQRSDGEAEKGLDRGGQRRRRCSNRSSSSSSSRPTAFPATKGMRNPLVTTTDLNGFATRNALIASAAHSSDLFFAV